MARFQNKPESGVLKTYNCSFSSSFFSKSLDVRLGEKTKRQRLNSAVITVSSVNLGTCPLLFVSTNQVFPHEVP